MTTDDVDDDRCAETLAMVLPDARLSRGKGRNGYASALVVARGDDELATVYGHSARAGEVHIVATSSACDEVVPVLRRLWPVHRVSRVDSAIDLSAAFKTHDAAALAFAERKGLRHELITNSEGGATRYIGGRSSEVRVRLYKKTEQLRALHPEKASEIPDGILRYECQVRPSKRAAKERMSAVSAADVWGAGTWVAEFMAHVIGLDAYGVAMQFHRPSSWVRSLHFLGKQYGPGVARRIEEVGAEQARFEVLAALGLREVEGPLRAGGLL